MLFGKVVETSREVASTRARSAKIDSFVALLRSATPEEIEPLVGFLAGTPRQGRIGVGSALLTSVTAPAAPTQTLAVLEVDQRLSALASIKGRGSAAARQHAIGELLQCATESEQDFLKRLLKGGLRQGALDGIATEAIAKAAGIPSQDVRRALLLSGDLKTVARTALTDGAGGLAQFRIELFRPLQPMLAQTANDPEDALSGDAGAAFDYKFDGARIQVHRLNDDIRVFTRQLNDVTNAVPEIVQAVRTLPNQSLVLDGEAIALRADGTPHPFQVTMRRFGRRLDVSKLQAELPISAFFFDCLHADGVDRIAESAAQRFALLDTSVPSALRVPRTVTDDPNVARDFLAQALQAGHEGLVAKSLSAPYEAGRRGAGWLKIKPTRTLDLVVLAVEWGSGRRHGWLSNIHLGALDPDSGSFVMLGKTFKGMTDAMLRWQTEKFLSLETHRQGHIVYVRPEVVAEIAFDGLQASSHYPAGLALRFARVRRYRPDKTPQEADTLPTVRALAGDAVQGVAT